MNEARWVCLMYHDITPAAPTAGGGPERFAVPVAEFGRQLDQLREQGYRACRLGEALGAPAPRTIAVTFDDGDAGQYERGFRALAERGMTATFFVTTDWIGRPGFATWDQLREMRAAGMEVQSHTRSHPFLAELEQPALEAELRGSKDVLDDRLAQQTDMLALPGGAWPRRALRPLLASCGYRVIATSRWGINGAPADGPAIVHRCTVSGTAGADLFGRIAAGDAALASRRRLRESVLGTLRAALGPSRYAAVRRRFLDTVAGDARGPE